MYNKIYKGVDAMEEYLTINKVLKLLGVSPRTLRNWDKANKLKPHHVSANGYRYYSKTDLNKFLKYQQKIE